MRSILVLFFFILTLKISAQTVNVSNATQLQNALNNAVAGQTIILANGVYSQSGGFSVPAGRHGTVNNPIKLLGNAQTIITSNNLNTGYGFYLNGCNYWILEGFTVYNSKKGIVFDESHYSIITNVKVNKIGDEAIHLRKYSSFNKVEKCFVDSTGIISTGIGEAIYVGSSVSNWPTYTGGNPDTCNYNIIDNNTFGDKIVSENIDIKEGTKNGVISNNVFNGKGLNNLNSADSWLDMKGNYYTIRCNMGSFSIKDGVQTHILETGWGDYNTFTGNNFNVGSTGYAINIQTSGSKGTAPNNVVCNNNQFSNATLGLTNVSTVSCASPAPAQPAAISGNTTVCVNTSIVYSIAAVTGASSYSWTLPSGWTGSSTGTSITTTVGATSGNISVVAVNTCGNSIARTLNVSVNTLPAQPGTISGPSSICQNASGTYNIASVSGATSYSWILPATWSGTSNAVSVTTTTGSSGGTLSVSAINSCGSSAPTSIQTTILSIPSTPSVVSGNTSVDYNTTNTYSVDLVNGNTYQWTYAGVHASIISGQNTSQIQLSSSASDETAILSVKAVNACGQSVQASELILTISDLQQTNVVDKAENNLMLLYPNPGRNQFYVKADRIKEIHVLSMQGTEVAQITNLQNMDTVLFQVEDLEAGMYVVEVHTEYGKQRSIWIKE